MLTIVPLKARGRQISSIDVDSRPGNRRDIDSECRGDLVRSRRGDTDADGSSRKSRIDK